jgi:hypothetical protein
MVVEEKRRDVDIAERVKPVRARLAPETGVKAKEVLDVDKTESATKAQRVKMGEVSGPATNSLCIILVEMSWAGTQLRFCDVVTIEIEIRFSSFFSRFLKMLAL